MLETLLLNHKIKLLIQDVRFGKHNAIDFLPELMRQYPQCKIIVLTSITDHYSINSILKLKPAGFLLKTDSLDTINFAINEVIQNRNYISEFVLEVKKQELNYKTNAPSLSKREKEVLQQILMEKNTPQIADALFVSVKTVEMHRANLFLKLGVKNITGLIKKAILFNLVDEI
jgi:DNA-binding NarL/FixJ family response regulator